MKRFRFSIDDNIYFLRDLAKERPNSIFDNSYMKALQKLHQKYNSKIQLNLFYQTEGFCLKEMPDIWKSEWKKSSDWLKLSFHSRSELPAFPYENADYDEVYNDCTLVQNEILRFAGEDLLSYFTTLHFTVATKDGCRALKDAGIKGLVGLFGTNEDPLTPYSLTKEICDKVRKTGLLYNIDDTLWHIPNDLIINTLEKKEQVNVLNSLQHKDFLEVMIHEQYFYKDYPYYQPDFIEKLETVLEWLNSQGFTSVFFEDFLD